MKIKVPSLHKSPILDQLAVRYVWWMSVDWAYAHPVIFLSNVMNLASWEDILLLRQVVDSEVLMAVLKSNPPGQFTARSWDFWHRKFSMRLRPMPKRKDL